MVVPILRDFHLTETGKSGGYNFGKKPLLKTQVHRLPVYFIFNLMDALDRLKLRYFSYIFVSEVGV
jgi:hypothetical protein